MYAVLLGQLRRRVLKFSEPPTIVGDGHRRRRSVVEGVHSATTQLNSTRRRVELLRYMNTLYDAASGSVTVADDRRWF